jgi:hypothetical protein
MSNQPQPGDRVSYVNDNLSGTVKRIIDKKQVLILLDDGFEIPANISELIITKSINGNSENTTPNDLSIIAEDVDTSDKVYFGAILEDTGKGQLVKPYLINTTSKLLQFSLFKISEGHVMGMAHGEIEPSRAMKLVTFQLSEASEYRNLFIQYMFFAEDQDSIPTPEKISFKIKPVALFKEKHIIPVLKQPGFLLNLTDINQAPTSDLPYYMRPVSKNEPIPDIIDLHLEELTDRPKALPPQEALQLQMSVFNQGLEKAIAHELPNITFIHGVGKGILKVEIRKVLGSNPYIQGFEDADPKKFGSGATIVYLKSR